MSDDDSLIETMVVSMSGTIPSSSPPVGTKDYLQSLVYVYYRDGSGDRRSKMVLRYPKDTDASLLRAILRRLRPG